MYFLPLRITIPLWVFLEKARGVRNGVQNDIIFRGRS